MPIVDNPVLSELVTEGIKKAGEANPSSSLITRATDQWVEEIKNDIWHLAKKPKILHITAYTIFNQGQSRYAYPSDYSSDLSLTLLYGTNQGAAQSASANTITLAASLTAGSEIIGKEILITAGTGQGSYSQIVTYNPTTKVAGVIPDWNMTPVASDTYMIIDVEYPIIVKPMFEWESQTKFPSQGIPSFAYPLGDDVQGYFTLDRPPDKLYGCRLRYYGDLSQIDTSSDLMSVLYRRWRNIWVQGIKAKKLQDEDDDRAVGERDEYRRQLTNLIYREIYGMDLSNITDRIGDYW